MLSHLMTTTSAFPSLWRTLSPWTPPRVPRSVLNPKTDSPFSRAWLKKLKKRFAPSRTSQSLWTLGAPPGPPRRTTLSTRRSSAAFSNWLMKTPLSSRVSGKEVSSSHSKWYKEATHTFLIKYKLKPINLYPNQLLNKRPTASNNFPTPFCSALTLTISFLLKISQSPVLFQNGQRNRSFCEDPQWRSHYLYIYSLIQTF